MLTNEKKHALGYSDNPDQYVVARHEAGHLLMLWLLGREVIACGATNGFGVTQQLDASSGEKETQHEHILYFLGGMLAEKNTFLLDELRQNITRPELFETQTDSYHIALAISLLGGEPTVWLNGYIECVSRLLRRFAKPLSETTRLVREQEIIGFDIIYDLFQKWDETYFADGRPKSDLVGRTLARVMGWRIPRTIKMGWDLKPLPGDWKLTPRPTLIDLARRVKQEMERMK